MESQTIAVFIFKPAANTAMETRRKNQAFIFGETPYWREGKCR